MHRRIFCSCSPSLFQSIKLNQSRCFSTPSSTSKPTKPQHEPIVFSGIQPTGALHLGNYLGALDNWVQLQHSHVPYAPSSSSTSPPEPSRPFSRYIYSIVDLHAITVPQKPENLRNSVRDVAISLLACGIDPSKSILFQQSKVHLHPYLSWILGCVTPMGSLNRMTQFKTKAGDDRESSSLGLYAYPVLQTADILLYKATHVPVGEDQKQHIELARDIAHIFNRQFGSHTFPLPESIFTSATRVMSLKDGRSKMSKSDPNDASRINLTDDADVIRKKIKKAKTDTIAGFTYDVDARPEVSNLISIFSTMGGRSIESITEEFGAASGEKFKEALADVVISRVSAIGKEVKRLQKDLDYVDRVLLDGERQANEIANRTIEEVKKQVGFH